MEPTHSRGERGWRFYETVPEAWSGNLTAAREMLSTLLGQLREAGTPKGEADAAVAAGVIALEQGDIPLATQAARVVAGRPLYNPGHGDVLGRL